MIQFKAVVDFISSFGILSKRFQSLKVSPEKPQNFNARTISTCEDI